MIPVPQEYAIQPTSSNGSSSMVSYQLLSISVNQLHQHLHRVLGVTETWLSYILLFIHPVSSLETVD